MNTIIIFILGLITGSIIAFFGIMTFAKKMDKKEKKRLIDIGKNKRK